MEESKYHSYLKNDPEVQRKFLECLKLDPNDAIFVSEDQYPNGMFADFTILDHNNKVLAVVELKGSDIGVNEYVRGIGQIFTYAHYLNKSIKFKDNYDYSGAIVVYSFPSEVITAGNYNVGLFDYPSNCKIIEFNENNFSFRQITKKDLEAFSGQRGKDLITISPYYVRDTRLYEIFIALRYCEIKKLTNASFVDRKKAETFLKQLNVPDNGNWRNVFISLSSLGLCDNKNIPTSVGDHYASLNYAEFCYEIYRSYVGTYFDTILKVLKRHHTDTTPISNVELAVYINLLYKNKQVLFLTDSKTRYISSWLNILRDDYGCISFKPKEKKKHIKIIYDLSECSKKKICEEILKQSKAFTYLDNFNKLINLGQ